MRKLEVVAGIVCGRFGTHGMRPGRMLAVPANEADAARPADAVVQLRHAQAIEIKRK